MVKAYIADSHHGKLTVNERSPSKDGEFELAKEAKNLLSERALKHN